MPPFDSHSMLSYVFYVNYSAISQRNPVSSRWPWSHFSRSPKVKLITPSDSQHITSYTSSIVTIALPRTETCFQQKTLIWPCKVTKGQTDYTIRFAAYKFLYVSYSNYSAISHKNPVSSRWPWSDLPRSPKVKLITPSDSQHITSYTSSILTLVLSRTETLFSADDLDLTFQGHQRSNWLHHSIRSI